VTRKKTHVAQCGRSEALARLRQAEAFAMVAGLVLDDASDTATPGVAAALAVLAGIAASDAACCARLGRRARGQSHADAVDLLATVAPGGADMAKDLGRILARKDDAHHGVTLLSDKEAARLVGHAQRLIERARAAVEA
jgi:hypothetical protein